jgi:HEAT repeat protein
MVCERSGLMTQGSRAMHIICLVTALLSAAGSFAAAAAKPSPADIEKAVAAIRAYDFGRSEKALRAVDQLMNATFGSPDLRGVLERELVRVLESDAPLAAKQYACRKLAIVGTDASLPALVKMLASPSDAAAEIACYSLAQIKSPAVNGILRDALGQAKGRALAAIVTLLGDRRDSESVGPVGRLVESNDPIVSGAAVAALGKIAGTQGAAILARLRTSASPRLCAAAQEASLQCARELAARGGPGEATKLYEQLMADEKTPMHVRRGALLGQIALGGPGATRLVLAVISRADDGLKAAAIAAIPTLRDPQAGALFAGKLAESPPADQVLLIDALVRLGDRKALPAIADAAQHPVRDVRCAALRALGTIGGAGSVPILVRALAGPAQEAEAAGTALRTLSGKGADAAIVKKMRGADEPLRIELIWVLADRRAAAAVPALLEETSSRHLPARRAALRGLGAVAGEADFPAMLKILVGLKGDECRPDAEQAVAGVARRIGDRSRAAQAVLAALRATKDAPAQCSLLRVLGTIADDRACAALVEAAQDADPQVKDAAIRVLADWPDARAVEPLGRILQSTSNKTHRTLALRGYVRLLAAGKEEPAVLAERYGRAMAAAEGADDKKLVLGALAGVPHRAALTLATDCLKHPAVRTEAATAAIAIARKLPDADAAAVSEAMTLVAASVGDGQLRDQAKALIRQPAPPKKP